MKSNSLQPYSIPPVDRLYRDGKYIRSGDDGRYLLLRGVCFGPVAKLPPHLPFKHREDWDTFLPYLDLLRISGLTTLRLAFIWHALEPTCDPDTPCYNESYADDFFYFVRKFEEAGFTVFIDVHQDLVQSAYGGGGLPHWIKEDGGKEGGVMLNTPWWGLNYVLNRPMRRTFTQFWKNDLTNTAVDPPLVHFPVLDRYLDLVEYLARRCKEHPNVIGIEVINEPHPAELNAEEFEAGILSNVYLECIKRIRKHSQDLFIMLSPQSDWNVNLRTDKDYRSHLTLDMSHDDRLVFAYHYYDSKLTALHGLHFHESKREEYEEAISLGVREASRRGMVPFLTEFGSRQNWFRVVTRKHMHWQFNAIEQSVVNATYWNVNLYNTASDRDGFMQEDFSLLDHDHKPRNLDMIVRPYPIASSAEPVRMHYNEHSHAFELVLYGTPSNEPTVIYLPYSIQNNALAIDPYGQGFKVYYRYDLINDVRTQFLPEANQLLIWLDTTIQDHHIIIVPSDRAVLASPEQLVFSVGDERS